jgi:hypothetical protein
MGTKRNAKTVTRAAEAKFKPISLSRSGGVARGKGKSTGNKQKRDNRAHSSQSSIFSPGTAVTGGVIDNLIEEYDEQVQLKENEIQRLIEEVSRLKLRAQEFRVLRDELQKQFQEAS